MRLPTSDPLCDPLHCAVPEKKHTPMEGLHPPPLPPGNSSLASYFASKILTFKTPLPLGISNDLRWVGMDFLCNKWCISRGFTKGAFHSSDLAVQTRSW